MSRIGGSVRYDADGDGVGEVATPGVRVTVGWPDGRATTVVSDAAGLFRVDTVLAGVYRLFVAPRDVPPNTALFAWELTLLFDGTPFDAVDFVLQAAASGRVAQLVALVRRRHAAVVAAFCWDEAALEDVAAEALGMCGLGADDAALTTAQVNDLGVALAVLVWRRVEETAALGFDFEADDAAFKRSQLAAQATAMRVRAEDRAWRLGICGFEPPVVEIGCMPLFEEGCSGGWRG